MRSDTAISGIIRGEGRRGLTLESIDGPALAAYKAELAMAISLRTAGLHLAPVRGVLRVLAANPCPPA